MYMHNSRTIKTLTFYDHYTGYLTHSIALKFRLEMVKIVLLYSPPFSHQRAVFIFIALM